MSGIQDRLIKVQGGREYLPAAARIHEFREVHGQKYGIVTEPIEINFEKQYAVFFCKIIDTENGGIVATGTKFENVRGFADYIEKAETGAVSRALHMFGISTMYAIDAREAEHEAQSYNQEVPTRPQETRTARPEVRQAPEAAPQESPP